MTTPVHAGDDEPDAAARYVGALRRHWLVMLLVVDVCVLAAVAFVSAAEQRYEAQAEVLVSPIRDSDNTYIGLDVLTDPDTSVLIVGRNLKSPQVAQTVANRLRLKVTGRKLLRSIEVRPIQQSSIVAVVASASSPRAAPRIANAFAEVVVERRSASFQRELRAAISRLRDSLSRPDTSRTEALALEERLAALRALEGAPDPTVSVLNRAIAPDQPAWPRPALTLAIALVVGLALSVAAALAVDSFDPRMVSEREVGGLPVLARIPRAPRRVVRRYLAGRGPLPASLWEAYRTLRASLSIHRVGEGSPRSILVTSAMAGEGKTMTSANLAIALAAGGLRVILVDGDLRRPMIASVFGVSDASGGFPELLYGGASPEDVLVSVRSFGENLRLVIVGADRPVDLLEARRVERVLGELKEEADVVIVDSPPVTEFADAVALGDAVDIVLIATRLGYSRRDRFHELLRFLSEHGVSPAGLVVTSRQRSRGFGNQPYRKEAGDVARRVEASGTLAESEPRALADRGSS